MSLSSLRGDALRPQARGSAIAVARCRNRWTEGRSVSGTPSSCRGGLHGCTGPIAILLSDMSYKNGRGWHTYGYTVLMRVIRKRPADG